MEIAGGRLVVGDFFDFDVVLGVFIWDSYCLFNSWLAAVRWVCGLAVRRHGQQAFILTFFYFVLRGAKMPYHLRMQKIAAE